MNARDALRAHFLAECGWQSARAECVAGDASNRRYDRLHKARNVTAILMDAPPDKGEDVSPFIKIARHLRNNGLAAPEILAQDPHNGFLLLEDLGDDLYARVLARQPDQELALYQAAVACLDELHRAPLLTDNIEHYDAPLMAQMAGLAWQWYRGEIAGHATVRTEQAVKRLEAVLSDHADPDPVLVLRDFHAENLLWRPDRVGNARVGIIDFQDAMIGSRFYDLASLLEDARRDVSRAVAQQVKHEFMQRADISHVWGETNFAVMAAQRNLRILGVFARLSMHFGKPNYIELIPRVWAHLQNDLAHPALASIREIVDADLPEPSVQHLNWLREQCATIPHRS